MNKELVKGITFIIDENKKLGTMRVDWYDGKLSNQWNPTNLLTNPKTRSKIDLGKLQQELNYIQIDLFLSFQNVENLCSGTGYDKEQVFSISL